MKIGNIEYVELSEVSEQLGVSKKTVKKWLEKYNVDYKDLGKRQFISLDNLENLLNRKERDVKQARKKQQQVGNDTGAKALKEVRKKKEKEKAKETATTNTQ